MHALAILSVHATLLLALPGPIPVPTGTTTTFTFNSAEQLTQVRRTTSPAQTLATSTYDGDGERVTKTEGSTTVIYVRDPSGNVLAEYNAGTGALIANYVYLNGHKVCRVAADGSRRYFHHDPLGTPRAVTDGSGVALWRGEHRPFGEVHTSNPAGGDPYTFTGHEWEDESSLLYAHARYYDPTVGRFLSTDPVGGSPGNPQSWNRYSYVQNNPLNATDPTGKILETLWDAANVGIGVVSLGYNLWHRNWGDAALDAGGVIVDVAATATPFVPGGAGTAIKAGRAAKAVAKADKVVDAARGGGRAVDAATPIGRRGNPMNVPRGTNAPTTIGGREFSGHAIDQMQGRGIMPSVVENVIQNGVRTAGSEAGTFQHVFEGVRVITNEAGRVITVIPR